MLRELNKCIDCVAFASLILDFEFPADKVLPAMVVCRVLVEDVYQATIRTETKEKAIEIFRSGAWC